MRHVILYNPFSGKGKSKEQAQQLCRQYTSASFLDITRIRCWPEFLQTLQKEDVIILCGGDGTLNRFINDTAGLLIRQEILYWATGSGNDFWREIAAGASEPIPIRSYLHGLPVVDVQGKRMRFLNGVGYGIDGYCCEEGDRLRAKGKQSIHYAAIAIRGLLFGYKPRNADVIVDGKHFHYEKVWMTPIMKGKYYGGGMIPTPMQDRCDPDGRISLMVIHGSGKLKTLMVFPSLFKGEHIAHGDIVEILQGHEISVQYDRPTPLQVDGETIPEVWYCCARSSKEKSRMDPA